MVLVTMQLPPLPDSLDCCNDPVEGCLDIPTLVRGEAGLEFVDLVSRCGCQTYQGSESSSLVDSTTAANQVDVTGLGSTMASPCKIMEGSILSMR